VSEPERDTPHVPAPSLWPIGFAIGVACILVGLVVSVPALIVGALITLVFGFLWVRDLFAAHPVTSAVSGEPEAAVATAGDVDQNVDRATFLSLATIGVGGLIGVGVTLPALGFAVLPSFMGEGIETYEVDLGPISNFSVGNVEGTGAKARISKYYRAYPGVHVDGLEKWLYPIPTPGSTS